MRKKKLNLTLLILLALGLTALNGIVLSLKKVSINKKQKVPEVRQEEKQELIEKVAKETAEKIVAEVKNTKIEAELTEVNDTKVDLAKKEEVKADRENTESYSLDDTIEELYGVKRKANNVFSVFFLCLAVGFFLCLFLS